MRETPLWAAIAERYIAVSQPTEGALEQARSLLGLPGQDSWLIRPDLFGTRGPEGATDWASAPLPRLAGMLELSQLEQARDVEQVRAFAEGALNSIFEAPSEAPHWVLAVNTIRPRDLTASEVAKLGQCIQSLDASDDAQSLYLFANIAGWLSAAAGIHSDPAVGEAISTFVAKLAQKIASLGDTNERDRLVRFCETCLCFAASDRDLASAVKRIASSLLAWVSGHEWLALRALRMAESLLVELPPRVTAPIRISYGAALERASM